MNDQPRNAHGNAISRWEDDGGARLERDFGYDNRSNATVRANRFGVAVRRAADHASECRSVSSVGLVHHSRSVHAGAGSENPSSDSICSNVRTTFEA